MSKRKLRPWVKKTALVGGLILSNIVVGNVVLDAWDANWEQHYEAPVKEVREQQRQQLERILRDNVIDQSELADYEYLINELGKGE